MLCPEMKKQAQAMENQISRHFVYLHGVLQNLEQELRNKLGQQRSNLQRDMEEFRNTLADSEEKLASACALAARAEANLGRVNLQKLTEKLFELADTPCHILQTEDYKEEIKIETDNTVYNSIRQHIKLHVPDVPPFRLVKTDDLPEDYELEPLPLPANETMITESSFRMNSQRDASFSAISTPSRCSSPSPSLNESTSPEPSSLEKGCKEIVRMTHFVNPTEFYVQRTSTIRILKELEADIAKYMESDPPKPENVILNCLYVVRCTQQNMWYRGRVISEQSGFSVTYKVLFIDYGFVEPGVTIDEIRCAQPQFNIQPGLAVQCSLAEIAPIDGNDWNSETLNRFLEIVRSSDQLVIYVLHVNEPVRTVELMSVSNNNMTTVTFREWLIDVKLAKPTTYYKLKRMNPLSAHQFFYQELQSDKYTNVEVSYVESPDTIYVKKVHQEKDYQMKMREFQYQFDKLEKSEDLTVKNPEYGNAVALLCGKLWLRGIITKIIHEVSKVEIFLVDIGSTQEVNYALVRRLPSRFCSWTVQAIRVALVDVKPIDNVQWSIEASAYLKTHLEGRLASIIPVSKTEETYNVCMYLDQKINVNALLVSEQYAQSTGHRSKHRDLDKDITVSKRSRKKAMKKVKARKEIEPSSSPTPKKEKTQPVEENDPYKVRVYINKIISPDIIYVSDCSGRERYRTMMAEMQKFYSSKKGSVQGALNPDWLYCVYSSKDKQFCRAQLVDVSETDPSLVKMTLIDLAEEEEIPLDEIQPLQPRFLDIPQHQFKIRLAGIQPCGGSTAWPSSSCQKLKDIITDTGDCKYYITLIEDAGPKDPVPVDLCIKRNVVAGPTEPNRKETVSVARCLYDHGLALPIRGFNLTKNEELKGLAIELRKILRFDSSKQISDMRNTIIEEEPNVNVDDSDSDVVTETQTDNNEENEKILDVSSESTPLPPKLTDWIEPAHIKETNFNANITYVDFEGNVSFHPDTKEYKDTLKYISDTLSKHYNHRSIKKYDYDWERGDLCIASYHVDKKWYRGRIVEIKNRQTVMVLFVDYGNIEECPVGSVKKRIILEQIPIQCTTARIAGINPKGSVWDVSDLDVIHASVVSKPCRITIVSRPPEPWKVDIWVKPTQSSTYYALPWYLKNKTTTRSIKFDNSAVYCQNDEIFKEDSEPTSRVMKNRMTEPISFSVNGEDSSQTEDDSSSENEDSGSKMNSSRQSVDSVIVYREFPDVSSRTLQENSELPSEKTLQMSSNNILNDFNNFSSKESSMYLSVVNSKNNSLNDTVDERISGNSIYLQTNGNYDFDTESVRSEALLYDVNNDNISASTPLNISHQDCDSDDIFGPINLATYGISVMEVSITGVNLDKSFSGYIIHTPHEELNQWIQKGLDLQEQLTDLAKEQPIHNIKLGKSCIAKFTDDNWYRARIITEVINGSHSGVLVEFVDYGNLMNIYNKESLRTARDEWLQIPMIGIRFKLHNVKFDKEMELKDIRKAVIKILTRKEKLTAIIKKYEPVLELELYWDNDCKESVLSQMFKAGILEILNSSVD